MKLRKMCSLGFLVEGLGRWQRRREGPVYGDELVISRVGQVQIFAQVYWLRDYKIRPILGK